MNDIMWKDDRGQWWFFAGVESISIFIRPEGSKGRPAQLECNTGQIVKGVRVVTPNTRPLCIGPGFNFVYHDPGQDGVCRRCGMKEP